MEDYISQINTTIIPPATGNYRSAGEDDAAIFASLKGPVEKKLSANDRRTLAAAKKYQEMTESTFKALSKNEQKAALAWARKYPFAGTWINDELRRRKMGPKEINAQRQAAAASEFTLMTEGDFAGSTKKNQKRALAWAKRYPNAGTWLNAEYIRRKNTPGFSYSAQSQAAKNKYAALDENKFRELSARERDTALAWARKNPCAGFWINTECERRKAMPKYQPLQAENTKKSVSAQLKYSVINEKNFQTYSNIERKKALLWAKRNPKKNIFLDQQVEQIRIKKLNILNMHSQSKFDVALGIDPSQVILDMEYDYELFTLEELLSEPL